MNNQQIASPRPTAPDEAEILKKLITKGDLSELSTPELVLYYTNFCRRHKLDPYSKPFDLLETINRRGEKKTVLYGNKECAAQLRKENGVSVYRLEEAEVNGYYVVTAFARLPNGQEDIDKGVAPVKGLNGDHYANAVKKAVTQAKRRVTLSICGLGLLDETEVDSVAGAERVDMPLAESDIDFELELKPKEIKQAPGSSLDQWQCGRRAAMEIINLCAALKAKKVTDELIKSWLPADVFSRKDLSAGQADEFSANLRLRLKLFEACEALVERGVERETIRMRLPFGVSRLADLKFEQLPEALKALSFWVSSIIEIEDN